MYSFHTQVNKLGQQVISRIVDQDGAEVAIIIAEHHGEIATWLVALMNAASRKPWTMFESTGFSNEL